MFTIVQTNWFYVPSHQWKQYCRVVGQWTRVVFVTMALAFFIRFFSNAMGLQWVYYIMSRFRLSANRLDEFSTKSRCSTIGEVTITFRVFDRFPVYSHDTVRVRFRLPFHYRAFLFATDGGKGRGKERRKGDGICRRFNITGPDDARARDNPLVVVSLVGTGRRERRYEIIFQTHCAQTSCI